MIKRVLIREVHYSHRVVDVPEGTSNEDIIRAALDEPEQYLEYSHTMDSQHHTVEPEEPTSELGKGCSGVVEIVASKEEFPNHFKKGSDQ